MKLASAYIGDVRVSPNDPQIVAAIGSEEEADILVEDQFIGRATDIIEVSCDRFGTIEPEQVSSELLDIKHILEQSNEEWPLIGTVRKYEDGGRWPEYEESEEQRLETVEAIADYVDAIDIELESETIYDRLMHVADSEDLTAIVSDHEKDSTPTKEEIYRRIDGMGRTDADIIKIAYKAESMSDMNRLFETLNEYVKDQSFDKPLSVIPMGEVGMPGRAFFPLFGSCFTYGCVGEGYGTAPGQRPVNTLKKELDEYEQEISNVGGRIPAQEDYTEEVGETINEIEIKALKRTP